VKRLLGLALECTERVEQDWKDYCRAYDKGVVSAAAAAKRGKKRGA
jgi:hypothetical protein